MNRLLHVLILVSLPGVLLAQPATDDPAMQRSIEELRSSIGRWNVVTDFLNEDGSVARSVAGTYEFSWIVPDRVVSGRSDTPELKQAAGILFYIDEAQRAIEMVSVGADGHLWIMTGPLGGDHRLSQEFATPSGQASQLRFTRFNVSATAFESKMDVTGDSGQTWTPGNHQRFTRAVG